MKLEVGSGYAVVTVVVLVEFTLATAVTVVVGTTMLVDVICLDLSAGKREGIGLIDGQSLWTSRYWLKGRRFHAS